MAARGHLTSYGADQPGRNSACAAGARYRQEVRLRSILHLTVVCLAMGMLLPQEVGGASETMVRTYKTRKQMDKEVKTLTAAGWRIAGQSGNFSRNMWTTSFLEREKITVTWVRP